MLLKFFFALQVSLFVKHGHAVLPDVLLSLILALAICKKDVLSLPWKPQSFELLNNLQWLFPYTKVLCHLHLFGVTLCKTKRSQLLLNDLNLSDILGFLNGATLLVKFQI